MWVGFNSLIIEDEHPLDTVHYLAPINFSPTNHAVLKSTMDQALETADKLGWII